MSETHVPQQHPLPERPAYQPPSRRNAEEDRVWSYLYQRVLAGDASTAEELIKVLDADLKAKGIRLALYAQAKVTVRKHKEAMAKQQRAAMRVKTAFSVVFGTPWRLAKAGVTFTVGVLGMLGPVSTKEPAKRRIAAIKADPDVAQAIARVQGGAAPAAPAETDGKSRDAKAA